jgi:hypothetical protein
MTEKISAQLALDLNLCYDKTQAEAAVAAGGKKEYTPDELLLGNFIPHDDAMFMVCRTEVTPARVLRKFAAVLAREELVKVQSHIHAPPLVSAVEFLESGGSDDPKALEEHAEAIQRFMVGQLFIEGDDMQDPAKIAAYQSLLASCKAVRAATKSDPGLAAYGVSKWAYKSVASSDRDELGKKHREQLAKIFRDRK